MLDRKHISEFNTHTVPTGCSSWFISLTDKTGYDEYELHFEYMNFPDSPDIDKTFVGRCNPYEYVALMENGFQVEFDGIQTAQTMEGGWYGLFAIKMSLYTVEDYLRNVEGIDINEPIETEENEN